MQYYPQHYFGFAVNGTVAEKLQLNEAFDTYEMSYDEEAMLSEAFNVEENSRLGCQIPITPDLNGLEVKLAPES